MNDFSLWFPIGVKHILAVDGYDHILFIILLVLSVKGTEYSKLFWLITSFTVGHSLSLALSVMINVPISSELIEVLISCTILFSAVFLLLGIQKQSKKSDRLFPLIVIFFGMIHGLGFSLALRSLLGRGETLLQPLLYFNLGIEAGQLIIVLLVVLFCLLLAGLFRLPQKTYKLILLCTIVIFAMLLTVNRLRYLF